MGVVAVRASACVFACVCGARYLAAVAYSPLGQEKTPMRSEACVCREEGLCFVFVLFFFRFVVFYCVPPADTSHLVHQRTRQLVGGPFV